MNTLIIYDSMYGNTEKIARAIGDGISGEVIIKHVNKVDLSELKTNSLVIVGSPTRGFRASEAIQSFLNTIPKGDLNNIMVAAFDTRMPEQDVGRGLKIIMKVGGYAAPRIAKMLEKKGGNLTVPPEGFFVIDREGPLKEGELERAKEWGRKISS